jgi:hypothetical protein
MNRFSKKVFGKAMRRIISLVDSNVACRGQGLKAACNRKLFAAAVDVVVSLKYRYSSASSGRNIPITAQ